MAMTTVETTLAEAEAEALRLDEVLSVAVCANAMVFSNTIKQILITTPCLFLKNVT